MSGVERAGASRAAEAALRCVQEGGHQVAERETAWEGGIRCREGQGRKEGGRCDVPVWIRRCTHKSGLEKAPSSRADLRSAGRIVEPGRRCYLIIQPVYLRRRSLEILSLKFIVAAVYLCICFRLVRTSSLCWDPQRDGADRVQSPAGPWQRPPATLRAATLGERSSECQVQEPGAGYE